MTTAYPVASNPARHCPCLRLSTILVALGSALVMAIGGSAGAADRAVRDADELKAAIQDATPGERIVLAPGRYRLPRITITRPGTAEAPITLTAAKPGETVLEPLDSTFLQIRAPHWIFEGLDILGDDTTEHAFHLMGPAAGTVLRGNRIRNFDSAVKSSGAGQGSERVYPNDVLLEGNAFWNERPRVANRPTNTVDVVGGRRWVLRGNFVADFAHANRSQTSYGMYLKGNSREGLMEGNLVICEWRHTGSLRIGLSFGGGGTGQQYCENQDCSTEHSDGIMRNNIVSNCPEDVGIYLNKSKSTKLFHNTLMNTAGIDVRFETSSADIRNNIILGRIKGRNGGIFTKDGNLELGTWQSMIGAKMGEASFLFRAPEILDLRLKDTKDVADLATPLPEAAGDFCGSKRRTRRTDLGAIDYGVGNCDVAQFHKRLVEAPWRR